MTLSKVLQSVAQTLRGAGIADAFVEAELLLGHILGMSKTGIYTEPERSLTPAEMEHLCHLVRRRLDREPTAYILGHCEFYGIDFHIGSQTFVPRPETEILVEKAVELAGRISRDGGQITIADIGTGCGAIAVSLALALPRAKIYATDVSAPALKVAETNSHRHGVDARVELVHGSLLEPLPQPVDMIVANLPYVRDCELADLSPEIVEYEPIIALAGGADGLDKIQEMLGQIRDKKGSAQRGEGPYCFLLEIGQGQGEMVTLLISNYLPQASVELIPDLSGIPRVVKTILGGVE